VGGGPDATEMSLVDGGIVHNKNGSQTDGGREFQLTGPETVNLWGP